MRYLIIASLFLALLGCTASIKNVDISQAEPNCARQCTTAYSSCVSQTAIGVPYSLMSACKDSFEKCIETCPSKNK
jgi:uncharacterized protein YgiB involved in biofilm formation